MTGISQHAWNARRAHNINAMNAVAHFASLARFCLERLLGMAREQFCDATPVLDVLVLVLR